MNKKSSKNIIILICFILYILIPINTYSYINSQKLNIKTKELLHKKQEIKQLKEKEKKLYLNIIKIEKKINSINQYIAGSKKKLIQLKEKEKKLKSQINVLKQEIRIKSKAIDQILKLLWKIYLKKNFTSYHIKDFEIINLKYFWLNSIYKEYTNRLQEVRIKQEEIKKKVLDLNLIKQKKESEIKSIEFKKDELLKNKIILFKKLQKIRAISELKEKQLEQIIDTVEKIKYNLKVLKTRDISKAKGYLLWPLKNKKNFVNKKKGIIILSNKNEPVLASFWGKVVYVGKLRGFGDVIVLYHGKGYYTLYAYLSHVMVRIGQMVELGEPIGKIGFCPIIKGYGLYFEIRKGKYILKPSTWLKK